MAEKDQALIDLAKKRFERAYDAENENRKEMLDDLRFSKGGIYQWPEDIRNDRKDKPMFTINRVAQHEKQILGDIKQNSPSIKVRPVDSGSDPDTAEVIEGLIRQIEQQSKARVAYNTAATFQVRCGYGVFKIVTRYLDDELFEQDAFIERVKNPFTVYLDPDAKDQTRKDGKFGFESEFLSEEEYKETYPNAQKLDFANQNNGERKELWYYDNKVRVMSYWVKEPVEKIIGQQFDGAVVDASKLDKQQLSLLKKTRKVKTHKVVNYKLSAFEVLDGPREFPSKYIPLIPVYGEEVNIEGETSYKGVIRDAKDPARLYNIWRTTGIETLALQPKAPYMATPKQVKGHESRWNAANKSNFPYLLYNPDDKALGAPQRQPPPQPSTAMWNEAQIASDDIKAATGIFDASLGNEGNETSGRAISARQRQSDTSNFIYVDNLSIAIEHAGEILVDMIPKIYDTERVVRILGEDDAEKMVMVNQVTPNGMINDITTGKYDVRIVVGPSYATKRQEAADSMIQFVQAVPQAGELAGDLIAKNMDWPGADAIAERLKKILPEGVAEPEEGEEQQIDPQVQMFIQQMQEEMQMMGEQMQAMAQELESKDREHDTKEYEAITKRLALMPDENAIQQIVINTLTELQQQ